MRLLKNICNEFVVFAEHMLWVKNPAPGMTADDLFALVVYKNFHLADFEAISQRASSLDKLEQRHRNLVRASIEFLQQKRREVVHTVELQRTQEEAARILGRQLIAIRDTLPNNTGYPYNLFSVGGADFGPDHVPTVPFWKHVAAAGSVSFVAKQNNYGPPVVHLDRTRVEILFPESLKADRWRDPSTSELAKQRQQYDRDIAFLRGADFSDLARYERFPGGEPTFSDEIANVLKSELARDLVRRGFINRNYAEYSATFYGSFIGVDVAFFYNHSVQPNEMYVDYQFKTSNAVSNLLEQVPSDFTSSVSALNIQVVSHLLTNNVAEAKNVIAFIVNDHSPDVKTFLNAFFNAEDAPREQLVALLAGQPWDELIEYVANHDGIPDEETRATLLDAALLNGLEAEAYKLGEKSLALLASSLPRLTAFSKTQPPERTERVLSFIKVAEILVADLSNLGEPLRQKVIAEQLYELTTSNLRIALGIEGEPTLDEVRKNDTVWTYCKEYADEYLAAAQGNDPIEYVVRTESVLRDVMTEQAQDWTSGQLGQVLRRSDPATALQDITTVPLSTWKAVIKAARATPTVENIWSYIQENQLDDDLTRFLAPDGKIPIDLLDADEAEDDVKNQLAVEILNASAHLPASVRVQLVRKLNLSAQLDAAALKPAGDDLLARALEADLVPDTAGTFAHFASAGWTSVADAFSVSEHMESILEPSLVSGIVAELLASPQVPHSVRETVVNELAMYVGDDNVAALRSAGEFAREMRIWLPLPEVQRIARVTQEPELVLPQLVHARNLRPEELMQVLALLGPPYSSLLDGSDTEFTMPPGSSNSTLFERLEKAGKVEIFKKGWGAGKTVRKLV
jgi:hypothetical protein